MFATFKHTRIAFIRRLSNVHNIFLYDILLILRFIKFRADSESQYCTLSISDTDYAKFKITATIILVI
jgi:hypothetical protein